MYWFYRTSEPPNHWLSIYTRHFIGWIKDKIPKVKIHHNTQNTETSIYRKPVSFSIPKEKALSSHTGKNSPHSPFNAHCSCPKCWERVAGRPSPRESCGFSTLSLVPLQGALFSLLAIFPINAQCSPEPREPCSPTSLETYTFCVPPFAIGPSLENQLGESILNKIGMPNENGSWSPTEESVL